MGSGRQQVDRLQGGSCSNNDNSNVVALTVAILGGGLCEESMRVRTGDGRRRTTKREGAVDDAGQAGGQGTTRQVGGADNARQAGGRQQEERTGAEDTTRGGSGSHATRPPLCAAWGGASWPPPGAAWGEQRNMVIIFYGENR